MYERTDVDSGAMLPPPNVPPPPPAGVVPPPPPATKRTRVAEQYIAMGAAGVAIIGAFLPWATLTTIFGSISVHGTDGDGQISAGLALVGLLTAVALSRWGLIVTIITGALVALIGIYHFSNVQGIIDEANSEGFIAQRGSGLYATALGGVGMVLAAALAVAKVSRSSSN